MSGCYESEIMKTVDIETARQYYYEREAQRHTKRETERYQWLQRVREAVLRLVPHYPGVQRIYLFGSLVQPGRFRPDSDIDMAVECDTIETESAFWQALEQELKRSVDIRPLVGVIADLATTNGELVYERQDTRPDK